jgi:hypothetical protein
MSHISRKQEKPTIELYLYSLNQEFPQSKGHAHFLKRHSEVAPDVARGLIGIESVESQTFAIGEKETPGDWSAQWLENQWIENHTKAVGLGVGELLDPIQNAILRNEDFGGILFDPSTDQVFKLNHAGLALFEEIRAFLKIKGGDIRSFTSLNHNAEDVREFSAYIEGAGLWIRR